MLARNQYICSKVEIAKIWSLVKNQNFWPEIEIAPKKSIFWSRFMLNANSFELKVIILSNNDGRPSGM